MTQKIFLTEEQKKELKQRLKNEPNVKIWRRLKCIDLKINGYKHKEISLFLDVTVDTITDWIFLYSEGGFDELCKLNYDGRRVSVLEKYKNQIEEKIEIDIVPTVNALQYWLKEEHQVEIEHSWLYRWLKKNKIYLKEN